MTDYHEPFDRLGDKVLDQSRALISLKEEIEAINWYNQRVAVCKRRNTEGNSRSQPG